MLQRRSHRSVVITLVALGALAQGCSDPASATLVALEPLEGGEDCPAGGVRLLTGTDTDADGELDPDEVASTELVCSGADGTNGTNGTNGTGGTPGTDGSNATGTAVRATALEAGDEDCPGGGLRFEAGLDDGADGGTAGDGILQDGEVDASQDVCFPAPADDPFAPPAGPTGLGSILAAGGTAASGCGGSGGRVLLGAPQSPGSPDPVRVHRSGTVDASFTMPTSPPYLGARPAHVTTDVTVPRLYDGDCNGVPSDPSSLTAGALYMLECEGVIGADLWIWDGSAGELATGLHVAAGATLTLPQHAGVTRVILADDVHLEGTVTVAQQGDGGRDLRLEGERLITAPGSRIDVSGTAGSLYADFDQIRAAGEIDARQTSSMTAGVTLLASGALWNEGTIDASGVVGENRSGGTIGLRTRTGVLASSGTLRANGGPGAPGERTGPGGRVELVAERGGLLVSGTLQADAAAGSCSSCNPARGGEIRLISSAGLLRSSATLQARGSAGTGGTEGGDGGTILSWVSDGEGSRAGTLWLSGTLDVRGGSTEDGDAGWGGSIEITTDSSGATGAIALFGVAVVDASGGAGGTCGGDGGTVEVEHSCAPLTAPSGGIAVSSTLSAHGGDATGSGGNGGSLAFATCETAVLEPQMGGARVVVHGPLELGGGASLDAGGGRGGALRARARDGLELLGPIDAAGGDGAEGGDAGSVDLNVLHGDAAVSADLALAGGAGSGQIDSTGGWGGNVLMVSERSSLLATCDLSGGDADDRGGAGGGLSVRSTMAPSTVTGAVDVRGGAAAAPGADGLVQVDGARR